VPLSRGGDAGGERETHEAAGREADALAQADDRVEHGTRGARQRRAVERCGIAGLRAASEEARAVGLPLHGPCVRPRAQRMHGQEPGSSADRGRRAAQQRGALRQVSGLDEQLAERRMGEVVGGRARTISA
jgi:hypothetical protein